MYCLPDTVFIFLVPLCHIYVAIFIQLKYGLIRFVLDPCDMNNNMKSKSKLLDPEQFCCIFMLTFVSKQIFI